MTKPVRQLPTPANIEIDPAEVDKLVDASTLPSKQRAAARRLALSVVQNSELATEILRRMNRGEATSEEVRIMPTLQQSLRRGYLDLGITKYHDEPDSGGL